MNDDPEIKIRLPLSAWQLVMGNLGKCAYWDVALLLETISSQAAAQIEAANNSSAETASGAVTEKSPPALLN